MAIKENSYKNFSTSIIQKHGGNVYQESQRMGIKENDFLDASASLVPFPPPAELQNHLVEALQNTTIKNYPDRDHSELKQSIANWHNIEPAMVFPGNGAAEINTWSAREASFIGLSDLPAPGFGDYERALKCWEGKFQHISLPLTWSSNSPQVFPLNSKADVLWITNPHNPTGQLWDRNSLEALLKKHSLIICDEAFLPITSYGEKHSLIPLIQNYDNLIVIRSLTKLFAIAGLRVGYAISSSKRIQRWYKWRDPWPLNSLAIAAGIMLLNNKVVMKTQIEKIERWLIEEKPWLHSKLNCLPGITAHPSSTNFQLIEGKTSLIELRNQLANRKILVRDCRSFSSLGENWLRVSLQRRPENKKIIQSMKEILKKI